MADFHDNRLIRVFISSTFRDMQDERDELMKKTFPMLRRKAAERDVTLTELDLRWGITPEESESGKVVEICLREIENSVPFFIGIIGNRYGWIPSSNDIGKSLKERFGQVEEYVERRLSVTEMEMQFGVLERPENMHAFFFIKEQKADDIDEPEKLAALKTAVHSNGRYPVSTYSSPEDLASQVEGAFTKLLDELFPEGALSELEKERIGQRAYLNSLCQNYIRTDANFAAIDDWMTDWDKHQLVITGASGLGKSALVANWIKEKLDLGDALPYRIISHFIGNGSSLGSHGHIVKTLCDEIRDRYGFDIDEKDIKTDEKALEELVNRVAAQGDMPLLIVLDAINQIIDTDNVKQLNWLPIPPKNVKILFTTLKGDQTMSVFKNRHYPVFTLKPLTKAQRGKMVRKYLDIFSKKLLPYQVERITSDRQCKNTLVLKSLLDELVNFGIFEKLDEKIDTYLETATVEEFYCILLKGYENDFGESFIKHILSLIAVSRNGLTEDEILSITKETPLHWSQFFCAFRQHLIVKNSLISFAHSYIRNAVENRYLRGKENWGKACRKEIVSFHDSYMSHRTMDEVPYQLFILNDLDKLHNILISVDVFSYLFEREKIPLGMYWRNLIKTGKYSLEEYFPCVERINKNNRSSVLEMLGSFTRDTVVDPGLSILFNKKALFYSTNETGKARLYNKLGLSYSLYGDDSRALRYHKMALKKWLNILGEIDTHVATSYANIGSAFAKLGNYKMALKYEKESIRIMILLLGEKHPVVASLYNNIGSTFKGIGNNKEALDYQMKALTIRLALYGEMHPDTAYSYTNVGNTLTALGENKRALEFERKALSIQLNLFGKEHPDVAYSLFFIGSAYTGLGNHKKALLSHSNALSIRLRLFKENHPSVADSYHHVGCSFCELGDLKRAAKYLKKALSIRKELYGDHHPDVASSFNYIGYVYGELGKYYEAMDYQKKGLDIRLKLFGESHMDVALSLDAVGSAYENLKEYDISLEYKQKALHVLLNLFGRNHPNIANSYNSIGLTYEEMGEKEKALTCYQKALAINLKLIDKTHPNTLGTYNNVSRIYGELGDYQKAIKYLEESLGFELPISRENDQMLASSYHRLWYYYKEVGAFEKALESEQKACRIYAYLYGEECSEVATLYNNIGATRTKLGNVDKGIELRKKGLEIALRIGDKKLSAALFNRVGLAYKSNGEKDIANEYFRQAAEQYQELGDEEQAQENLNLIEETNSY